MCSALPEAGVAPVAVPKRGGCQEQPYEVTRQQSALALESIRRTCPHTLFAWLSELYYPELDTNYLAKFVDAEPFVDGRAKVVLYTTGHRYAISIRLPKDDKGYLGCIAVMRKPLAGEQHTRGRDLPDGGLSKETWNRILAGIVCHETIPLGE